MLVELTTDELGIINGALNAVCNGIHLEGGLTLEWAAQSRKRESFWRRFTPLYQVNKRYRLIVTQPERF